MIQKHKSVLEKVVWGMLGVFLLVSAFFIGRFSNTSGNISESATVSGADILAGNAKQVNIKTIAVVNADAGTYVNDEYINYAGRMLNFLDENYVMTNIESARNGVENGTYAAYILIPSSFSDNLVSLNRVPEKTGLEYAINDNLIEERRVETIYRIVDFERQLNEEMSYMYVASVLEQFHDVQDGAQTIMDNDVKETEIILAIQAADLIEMVPVPEILYVDYSVEPLDVTDYNNKNEEIISEIDSSYVYFISLSEEDMANLQQQGTELTTQWENMEASIRNVDFSVDAEGNTISENGLDELESWLNEYNNVTLVAYENETITYLDQMSVSMNDCANEFDGAINEYNNTLEVGKNNAVAELMMQIEEAKEGNGTVNAYDIKLILNRNIEPFEGSIYEGTDKETTMSLWLRAESRRIQRHVNEKQLYQIPRITINEMIEVIEQKIVAPLMEQAEIKKQALIEQYEAEKIELSKYNTMLLEYDPLENIDESVIQGYIGDMQENNTTMHVVIAENYEDNMEYVEDVYETTEENVSTLQENIYESQEASDLAVENGLEEAKSLKSSTSETNQLLLADFKAKLPYTRIGMVDNTQVYDFIVDPIKLEYSESDDSKYGTVGGQSNVLLAKENIIESNPTMGWIIGIILAASVIGMIVMTIWKKNETEIEGDL